MEYIYGYDGEREILKTIGNKHSELLGRFASVRVTDVDSTEDICIIVRKLSSFEGDDGKCYDIYEIENHQRQTDKTISLLGKVAQQRADIDYIAMETGVELEG